ncbi:MAG: Asp-tRNA(Asn)/Glu-tRNA(Gln) amidotransferase subunit GatC [Gammaproteobacteria bacterium]
MSLGPKDVHKIASLARLAVADEQLDAVTDNLSRILDFVEQLQAIDTDGVAPMAHPLGDVPLKLRDDSADPAIDRDRWQAQAPDTAEGFYRVPKVIE